MERALDEAALDDPPWHPGRNAGVLHAFLRPSHYAGGCGDDGTWRQVRVGGRTWTRVWRPVPSGEIRRRRPPRPPFFREGHEIHQPPDRQMVAKRLIACLDVRDGCVVKGVRFEGLANAGDPAALARRYNAEGIDELVILDVTATLERRRAMEDTLRRVSAELFIPLAVGGGIRSE